MAQLTHSTQNDSVSQFLKDLEDLSIELEIEEIKSMKKHFLKKIVREAFQKDVSLYLQRRKKAEIQKMLRGKKLI